MIGPETVGERLGKLMRLAQCGDSVAYAELLNEITPLLRRLVRRQRPFLRPEDIEDLVQDTLLSMHSVRATYDAARPFLPWLFAINRNRLADAARRYSSREGRQIAIDDTNVTFGAAVANTITETYGDPQALQRAIGGLPPGQRDAIEMLKLKEMSLKEASEASGMSIGALKVATHRAMSALRKMLKER